ncbi:pentaheme c-type cytochrome TorC [Roseovarius sp. 2305UL8-3]|uniref:pentaheme c-type cytochrome TorC n=1 Tax=Roseovarius conchicola TaxID=3121636 RepID=UPI003527B7D4
MIKRLWNRFWGPAGTISLGVLAIGGFVAGIVFWGGFNTAMEYTNELEFCISCHEMAENVYPDYKASPHFMNASGVGAICSDCHVPKKWFPKVIRKVQATKELYGHFTGKIDTPEKFEEHRAAMAMKVWAKMEANDSLECRNCHDESHMDFALQSEKAAKEMKAGFERGDTCIDCHKGIAHRLPDLSKGYRKKFEDLTAMAEAHSPSGDTAYPLVTIPFFASAAEVEAGEDAIGQFLAATELKVVDRDNGMLKVAVEGWQQDGVEQVVYALRGQRIFEATVKKSAIDIIETHGTETDENTDLVWHQVSLEGWVAPGTLLEDDEEIWAYTKEMYGASCGMCHSKPDPGHTLANQWIGVLKSMKRFITLDKEEYRILQKYLQLNAKDTGAAGHHD